MSELNSTGLLLVIELYLFCILILTILFIYSMRLAFNKKFIAGRLILLVNVCYGIVVDVDLLNAVFATSLMDYVVIGYIINIIRYVMYILAALFWFLYCQKSFESRLFTKKVFILLASIPAIISVALVLMSPINGTVFGIESSGVVQGPLYIILQHTSYLYIISAAVFAIIRIVKVKDTDYRKRNWAIIIYAVPLILSDVLQTITGFPLLCVGVCIALTLVFIDLIIDVYYKSESREATSKLQSIIEALAYEYVILAVLNLDTGDMDKYRESDNYKAKMVFESDVHEYNTVLNKFASEFVEEGYKDAFVKEMNPEIIVDYLADHKIYSVRFKLTGMDKWYEVNMSDYDEATRSVVIGGRNIDDVVKAERHREELKRELEDARKTEFIAGLTQDFDCVSYIDVNNGFKETFYRTSPIFFNRIPESAKGKGFDVRMQAYSEIFVVPDDREKFLKDVHTTSLMRNLQDRSVYFVNFRINVDGMVRYYQIKFNANIVEGRIQSITAGFHDVDDEMKMELKRQEQLEKAKRAAEEGSQAKSLFLFNMSHDIRTPMNAIIGFTNIAMKNIEDKERAIDALKKTRESSDVLLSLINQILDMSRIESGKVVLAEDKADMISFGYAVQPMLIELAKNKNIDYTFDIDNIVDRYVILDKVRINEVIVNLVSNAIKYTQEGGEVRAHVRQLESDVDDFGLYEFSVSDNGFGMSKEFQEHLFENFAREESSATSGVEGTGLGLPLCKRIVDLMDGTIEVISEKDVGSTFTVTLPLKKREYDVVDEEDYEEDAGIDFSGKRILLAEDNDLNREIATEILKEEGFEIDDAKNGREAVEKVRDNGEAYYDFILMDIRMPVMDGYEATKYIRGLCKDRHIPIIALSANAFEEDRAKSIKVGMDDHVAKPIEVDSLKKTLSRFV